MVEVRIADLMSELDTWAPSGSQVNGRPFEPARGEHREPGCDASVPGSGNDERGGLN
jgi:hypothetical protein